MAGFPLVAPFVVRLGSNKDEQRGRGEQALLATSSHPHKIGNYRNIRRVVR
jgi:hypothetical protein